MKKYVLALLALASSCCTTLLAQRVVPLENSATNEGLEALLKKESVYLQDQGNLLPKYEGQWTGTYGGHKIIATLTLQRKHQVEASEDIPQPLFTDRLVLSYQVLDAAGKVILDTAKKPSLIGEGSTLEVRREGGQPGAKVLEEHYELSLPLDDKGTCIFAKAVLSKDLKELTLVMTDVIIATEAGDCPDYIPGIEESWVLTRTSPVPSVTK